jgi:hypothetical protein
VIDEGIYSRLNTYAGTSALVSGRIYPDIMPQGVTYPAITYSRISAVRIDNLGSFSGSARVRYQFDCWHTNPTTARAVRRQVRLAMDGFNGTFASCIVSGARLLNEFDSYEDDTKVYRRGADYEIWHKEE